MVVLYGDNTFSIVVFLSKKRYSSFWKKGFRFPENVSKLKYWKRSKFLLMSHKNMPISQTESYFENP